MTIETKLHLPAALYAQLDVSARGRGASLEAEIVTRLIASLADEIAEDMSPPSEAAPVWGLVELMGHRRLYGRVAEVQFCGATMLRVEALSNDGARFELVQHVAPAALYAFTEMPEAALRVALARTYGYSHPELSPPEDGYGWDDGDAPVNAGEGI